MKKVLLAIIVLSAVNLGAAFAPIFSPSVPSPDWFFVSSGHELISVPTETKKPVYDWVKALEVTLRSQRAVAISS